MRKWVRRGIVSLLVIPLLAAAAWCAYYPFSTLALKASPV